MWICGVLLSLLSCCALKLTRRFTDGQLLITSYLRCRWFRRPQLRSPPLISIIRTQISIYILRGAEISLRTTLECAAELFLWCGTNHCRTPSVWTDWSAMERWMDGWMGKKCKVEAWFTGHSYQEAREENGIFTKLLRESIHLFYDVNPRDLSRTSSSSTLKYSLSSNTGHGVK